MANRKGIFVCSSLLLALSSCAGGKGLFQLYENGPLAEDPIPEIVGQGYRRDSTFGTIHTSDRGDLSSDLATIYSYGAARRVMPSTGRQRLTVIPVDFATYPGADLGEGAIDNIRKAFFGDGNGNQYYSVAEYYDKSSFHRFQLEGDVDDQWFRPSATYEKLVSLPTPKQTKPALETIYREAFQWHNETYPDNELEAGDPIFFVYSAPYSGMDDGKTDRNNMMWAFVINDPAPIGWSSYHMFHVNGDSQVDAHTNIHEFGHMLGLIDYYDTDSTVDPSPCSPLGRMDMMDCSIGDHGAFSKMLLNWTMPYVVNDSCEITIRPQEGNGDCILVTNSWNGTPFDEYLLLELYTPSYLNSFDAKGERSDGVRLMGRPGVKITHVDARLGVYNDRNKAPLRYLEGNELGSNSVDFYQNNNGTVSGSVVTPKRDNFLLRTLYRSATSKALPAYFVSSDADVDRDYEGITVRYRDVLFGAGDTIQGYALNSKGVLPYSIHIDELTSTYAKISFRK